MAEYWGSGDIKTSNYTYDNMSENEQVRDDELDALETHAETVQYHSDNSEKHKALVAKELRYKS